MMKACKCGSYAINHNCHGRDGSDDDLCDVCYWRKRAEQPAQQPFGHTAAANAALRDAQNRSYQIAKAAQQEPMTTQTEADRLANQLDYHREYDLGVTHTGIDEQAAAELRRQQAEIERLNEALAQQPAQQELVSDRENAIIRFALHQFMSNAYSNMNAAAQDKDSRHYTVGAVEKFAKDAKDAEALLSRLQFKAPQPAQRTWVGLTDEQWQSIADTLGCIITRGQKDAIEAKLREKNQ